MTQVFFKDCPAQAGGQTWDLLVFVYFISKKERLRPLGYCAPHDDPSLTTSEWDPEVKFTSVGINLWAFKICDCDGNFSCRSDLFQILLWLQVCLFSSNLFSLGILMTTFFQFWTWVLWCVTARTSVKVDPAGFVDVWEERERVRERLRRWKSESERERDRPSKSHD